MRRIVCYATTCPAGIISTGSYGMDAAFMTFQRHGA